MIINLTQSSMQMPRYHLEYFAQLHVINISLIRLLVLD